MGAAGVSIPNDSLLQWIEADYGIMYRILLNILSNAIKFTQKGSITLTANSLKKEVLRCSLNLKLQIRASVFLQRKQEKYLRSFIDCTHRRMVNLRNMALDSIL